MPAIQNLTPRPELALRLQAEAQRNPRGYRARLLALALFGDLTLTIAQVLPLALPILVGAMWMQQPVFYWIAAGLIVLVTWFTRPQFRHRGREITRDEAPGFFMELDRLREQLDVPGAMQVYLDERFNASAGESPGLVALVRNRRALTLGMPLLVTLTPEQLLGVVAHELGHFSRRHGRFGHWLYRAREGWIDYAEQLDESTSPLERFAASFAQTFVPFFSVRSFVYSRMCEFEADRDAAQAVGAANMAQSLSRIMVLSRVWNDGIPRELTRLQAQSPQPPTALYQHFAAAVAAWPHETQQRWLAEEMAMPSGWRDTHPALADRLGALGESPSLAGGETAGITLFGDTWPALLSEFNAKWHSRIEPEWLMQHLRLTHIVQPLVDATPEEARAWSEEQRLARAKALRWVRPADGRAELEALRLEFPQNSRIAFAYASALLNDDDEPGVAAMEALVQGHPVLRSPGYARLAQYFARRGDTERADYWRDRLRQSGMRRSEALYTVMKQAAVAIGDPSSLGQAERRVLQEALARDTCVRRAWLMQGIAPLATAESKHAADMTVHVLVLAVDPEEAARRNEGEQDIDARYGQALDALAPPDEELAVRTYFTTEPIPEFDAKLLVCEKS